MSTSVASADPRQKSAAGQPAVERRRRKRAKISAQVHVSCADSAQHFEEICRSVDVSRDGIYFLTARSTYQKGQRLEIVFPYSSAAAALNQAQAAEVVRVADAGSGQRGVAVQFLAARPESAAGSKGSEAAGNGSSAQTKQQPVVLIVESEQRTAETMRGILQNDGYVVQIVSKAQQALELLRTTVPSVFIAEVEGEDMSGHDLCLIIKRNDRLQHVPVILLTRSAQPADYSASHQLGAVVCMAKPFKPERLLHVVRLVAPPPVVGTSIYNARVSAGAIERSF